MRNATIFVIGLIVGASVHSLLAQAPARGKIVGLNHVAISVDDYQAGLDFYEKKLGFKPAFTFTQPNGDPYFTYFQINRNTFVEVMKSTPDRPAGCPHFGVEVENLDALVAELKDRGVQVRPISVSPRTHSRSATALGPSGVNMELLEMGPDSLHRKAMDAWK